MAKIPHDPDEIIAIVDENDNVIDKRKRKEIHDLGLVHRECGLLVINMKDEMLLQKRRDNELYDFSASGHFEHDTDYEDAIVREAKEELGIDIDKEDISPIAKKYMEHIGKKVNKRFIAAYEVKGDYPIESFVIDEEELESVEYMSVEKISKMIEQHANRFTDGFIMIFKDWLKKKKE